MPYLPQALYSSFMIWSLFSCPACLPCLMEKCETESWHIAASLHLLEQKYAPSACQFCFWSAPATSKGYWCKQLLQWWIQEQGTMTAVKMYWEFLVSLCFSNKCLKAFPAQHQANCEGLNGLGLFSQPGVHESHFWESQSSLLHIKDD